MLIRIHAPPYHFASGGIRVLHRLGALAHQLGHNVDMGTEVLNPEWGQYHEAFNDDADLIIVPEIHPATAPGPVVRWVLYFPGALAGPTTYPQHELVVSFSREYLQAAIAATPFRFVYLFQLGTCELPGLLAEVKRDVPSCYWQGKGERINPPGDAMLREISRSWPNPRSELVKLLKSCVTLYSCDPHTALNEEALLCGCDVRVWSGQTWERYVTRGERLVPREDDLERVAYFLEICYEQRWRCP